MPANDLFRFVALDLLGTGIPTDNATGSIQHDDGVIFYVFDHEPQALLAFPQQLFETTAFGDIRGNAGHGIDFSGIITKRKFNGQMRARAVLILHGFLKFDHLSTGDDGPVMFVGDLGEFLAGDVKHGFALDLIAGTAGDFSELAVDEQVAACKIFEKDNRWNVVQDGFHERLAFFDFLLNLFPKAQVMVNEEKGKQSPGAASQTASHDDDGVLAGAG